MKICLIADYLPGIHKNWSGAELVCHKLGELLTAAGEQVSFVALDEDSSDHPLNVHLVKTLFGGQSFIGKNFLLDFRALFSIVNILKKTKPDIVHIQAKALFLPSACACRMLKIPYFYTVLDYYNLCPRNMLLRSGDELCQSHHGPECVECFCLSKRPIVNRINKCVPGFAKRWFCNIRMNTVNRFMRHASKVITFSETSRHRLTACGYPDDKIEVIYHYPFETHGAARTGSDDNNKNVLFVGAFSEHKGLHIAVEAFKKVADNIPDAKLQIIGGGREDYRIRIENLIRKLNVENNVEFLGRKNNKQVLDLIDKSALVVVPEQWYSEFGPVILIETKLMRKPVVASKIGSIPEFIRDGKDGLLAEHNNPDQFSDAIIKMLNEPQLAVETGNNVSQQILSVADTQGMLRELKNLYQNAIG